MEEFDYKDLIAKEADLQGNTKFLLAENSLSSFCESFWYLENMIGANLLENIQSRPNGRGSTDANYLECSFVLWQLYLLSSPRHLPIPYSCSDKFPLKLYFSSATHTHLCLVCA